MSPEPAVDIVELMARLPVAVYRTTPSGRILTANAAFAELIGAGSVDRLHDLDVRSLYVDPASRDHMVERVASGIQIDPEEIQLRRLDGGVIWVRVSSLGVHAADGSVQFYEGVIEDVTARHRSDRELARSTALLAAVTRAQNRYLTGSTIGAVFDDLLSDVLDLAKIEADRHQPELGPTDVGVIAGEAVAIIRESAAAKQLSVGLLCSDDLPEIVADSRRTKQVMVNLLSNAVKFTEPGGRIGLDARADSDAITVEVWDTGIGIPPDRVDDLFIPFQQIDSALSRQQGGTGLGLALSRKLIEAQGGEMFFETELGRGSRFGFRLPVSGWSLDPGTDSTGDITEPSGPVMTGTVLVVDDNDLNRMLVADYLLAHGLEVIEAHDGQEAVEAAIASRPDAIVMDIQMPRRDGLSATRELKSRADTGAIPIVALTALAMDGDRERCLEAGCDDYLSKLCGPAVVLATLARLVQTL